MQGMKLTFIPSSHLAPKYFKVVANSKKWVAIMTHSKKQFLPCHYTSMSYEEDTRMGHIQHERLPNPRFTFEIMHLLHFGNELNKELCCRFIFTNLQQSLDF